MKESVFIHLPEQGHFPDQGVRPPTWTRSGLNGAACRQEPLQAIATAVSGARVVVVVPGLDVLLTQASPPKASRSDQERAVPFLLEEQLADPVENLHVVLGRQRPDGTLPVVVVARTLLNHWLGTLAKAGISPHAVVCETLLLPWRPGSWTVLVTDDKALVRSGGETGFAADVDNLAPLLKILLDGTWNPDQTAQPPQQIRLLDYTNNRQCPDLAGLEIPLRREPRQGSILPIFTATYAQQPGINLLQGHFSTKDSKRGWWQPFRMTTLMLVAWILFRAGYDLWEVHRLTQQVQQTEQQIEQLFRKAFPKVQRVVDPRVQMEGKLADMRRAGGANRSGFLTLIGASGNVLKKTTGVELKRIRYQDGRLDLFLRVKSLHQLDQIKQQVQKRPGLAAVIQNANREKGRVECHLRITGQ